MPKFALMIIMILTAGFVSTPSIADDRALAEDMATLFRSARAVISKNQKHINDPGVGDKGLGSAKVVADAKANFLAATGRELDESHPYLKAELVAIGEVMDEAQNLINEKDKGFKGFLPAVFAKRVADKTSSKLDGKAKIKLTAPKKYVRNRANRPDVWEHQVLEEILSTMTAEQNEPHAELVAVNGAPAFRFILPEFYNQSCLSCHGQPAGELDITGGKKEGGVLHELGGAISVVIFK